MEEEEELMVLVPPVVGKPVEKRMHKERQRMDRDIIRISSQHAMK